MPKQFELLYQHNQDSISNNQKVKEVHFMKSIKIYDILTGKVPGKAASSKATFVFGSTPKVVLASIVVRGFF